MEVKPYSSPNAIQESIFATKEYLSALSNEFCWIGGYLDGVCVCYIAFVIKHRLIFRYLAFQNSIVAIGNGYHPDMEKNFLESTVAYFATKKIDFIVQPPTNVLFNSYPEKSAHIPFGSYVIDLEKSDDELWKNVHSKHRNVIRNAEKNGVVIHHSPEELNEAYAMISNTMRRDSRLFIEWEAFRAIVEAFAGGVEIFIARKDDKIQGAAVFPHDDRRAYYLWGGSIEKPFSGAMNYLHWKAILHFKETGLTEYDLVGARLMTAAGSRLEGIQRFKERFGGVLRTGYLWRYVYNPFKWELYHFLLRLRARSFYVDIIDQESRNRRAYEKNSIDI